jgi:phosphoserine phosphatase RsbU/P
VEQHRAANAWKLAPKPATILIVDDSPVNLQVLLRTLENTGHRLLVATGGKSALDIVTRARPDMILLDVMMPEIDGFDVCRIVKSDPGTRDVVIIFLSALGEVADKVAGLELGAADYITKPIQAEEVLARVSNHLKQQQLEREVRQSRDALDRELSSAAEMQRMILPPALPNIGCLRFHAYYQTSRYVGGDYYDVVELPGDCCGVLLVDVSGHGAPSAIVMAMVRAVFHAYPGPPIDPGAVLKFINDQFRFLWGSSILATALYAVIDGRTRRTSVACAGHYPPLLMRGSTVVPVELEGTIPLLITDIPSIPCNEQILAEGDRLLFYTDGITERESADERMYDLSGLSEALITAHQTSSGDLLPEIMRSVDGFAGGEEPHDDQTLLLVSA